MMDLYAVFSRPARRREFDWWSYCASTSASAECFSFDRKRKMQNLRQGSPAVLKANRKITND